MILKINQFCLFYLRLSRNLSQNSKNIIEFDHSYAHSRVVNVCERFARRPVIFRPWFLRYIPKGGYPIKIDYIDTKPEAKNNENEDFKTIVLLHGTPGSYYDFFRFIVDFGTKYRIICPNFPNFNHTIETGVFWHSAEEKSEFVADFLKDLNIKKVHCLIAHSLAAYTASYLWIYCNNDNYFKLNSICLLSPIGKYQFSSLQRLSMKMISQLSRLLAFRIIPSGWLNLKKSPIQNIFSNNDLAAWKILTENLSNYKNYHIRLKVLHSMKIPTLFIFCSNDKLYSPLIYYDQLYQLQVDNNDFDIYEQYENNLIQKSENNSWIKVVDFRSGGHYMHSTHSYLIHSYIDELLESC